MSSLLEVYIPVLDNLEHNIIFKASGFSVSVVVLCDTFSAFVLL